MPRALALIVLVFLAGLAAFWASGAGQGIATLAQSAQRVAQTQMASALRALHGGEAGALLTLWGLCLAYGLAHAIGPGHGKVVLGAYGAARAIGPARIVGLGMGASLAQGASAVALVLGGVTLLGATRAQVTGLADGLLEQAGLWAVLALGLWLIRRGGRGLWALRAVQEHDHHAPHPPPHDAPCATCSHHHGPSPAQILAATTPREMALLIGAIALRPCTGALFLLILTWRMGLVWQGLVGVLVMAFGTGIITSAAGLAAVGARASLLSFTDRLRPVAATLELVAGALVVLVTASALRLI
ncbi:MAG: nickel/cobalt transporter [Roseinatronobacter sp.]